MLISHRKKFIFAKTVKTASTSVELFFEPYCMHDGEWAPMQGRNQYVSDAGVIGFRGRDPGGKSWYNHMSSHQIKEQIGDDVWDKYLKFTTVRNPFDKMISGFYMFVKNKNWNRKKIQGWSGAIRKRIRKYKQKKSKHRHNEILQFRSWVRSGGIISDRDKYLIDGEICMDHFVRYENLNDDVSRICRMLDIPYTNGCLGKFNAMFRNRAIPIQEFYDEPTKNIVRELFELEFDRFGYSFPA